MSRHLSVLVPVFLQNKALENDLSAFETQLKEKQDEKNALEKLKIGKKEEEIPQEEKDKMQEVSKEITRIENEKRDKLSEYGKEDKLSKQLLDLALLANNMLKGEALDQFVKRSVELIK